METDVSDRDVCIHLQDYVCYNPETAIWAGLVVENWQLNVRLSLLNITAYPFLWYCARDLVEEPPQNSRCQMGYIKQFEYSEPAN
jgi:hypothetical protein